MPSRSAGRASDIASAGWGASLLLVVATRAERDEVAKVVGYRLLH
jgi:hypothetical protein